MANEPLSIGVDFETGPQPDDQLRAVMPSLKPSKVKDYKLIAEPFDPDTVKYGNAVDPTKREVKLQTSKDAYEARVKVAIKALEKAKAEQWEKFLDDAALHAETGCILAAGYITDKCQIDGRDERTIIEHFYKTFREATDRGRRIIGFNTHGFDWPFVVHRGWVHGIQPPVNFLKGNRYWNDLSVDLAVVWACGVHGTFPKLDTVAKTLGVGGKPDDVGGGDFARLWFGTPAEKKKAKQYLLNDLKITRAVAQKLGVWIDE